MELFEKIRDQYVNSGFSKDTWTYKELEEMQGDSYTEPLYISDIVSKSHNVRLNRLLLDVEKNGIISIQQMKEKGLKHWKSEGFGAKTLHELGKIFDSI